MSNHSLDQIYNFLPISPTLGTAGQPTAEQFDAVRDAGYGVVINLAMPDSPKALPGEAELVTERGMAYIPIPVEWEAPTSADLDRFFAAMNEHREKKRFVHCIANMRVSAFVFLYRVLEEGVPAAEARQSLHQIWEPNPVWQGFVERELARRSG